MDTQQSTSNRRKKLVIDDDEDDEPQTIAPKQPEKKEQPKESAEVSAPQPNKNLKQENGNGKSVQNNQQAKNNSDLNKKVQEKVQRKDQEKIQNSSQKMEIESDGHASDRDLFIADDSNSQDIQEIRNKYGWKPKQAPQSAPKQSKPSSSSSSGQKSTSSSRNREEPVRKGKDTIVYEILKRWWYALPDWPPANYNYSSALEQNKLRVINKQKFRIEPDLDERGFLKVYEILGFQGMYKDANNKLYDLRPQEGKPSYNNLSRKNESELLSLLKTCYQNQIEQLEMSQVVDQNLLDILKKQLEKIKQRVRD
ncbi:hypothetical protein TTHERM_00118590 (macronuclear) [Tetrahymena thermophila SB210]|uniref:Uncharacterized protein n=1 Tax=Tetrahymena thermophila (strain SB210) TaxID=312017 RepID=Q22Z07_TETTS|nr:hypothetical protein TTHERM_00118590 [Tetrahymena thermophila SB210]EAR90514.3 hypothetical protein TTHERM_00118590 [Tetrahymena thermophila SB210]|eukprot:XP_001010759.3 hypothetical protein TTHERM_00118590 [Tetrahymena thermophila SB210]